MTRITKPKNVADENHFKCFIVYNETRYRQSQHPYLYTHFVKCLETVGFNCIEVFEHQLGSRINEIISPNVVLFLESFLHGVTTREAQNLLNNIKGIKVFVGLDDEYHYRWTLALAPYMHKVFTNDTVAFEYLKQLGIPCSIWTNPVPMVENSKRVEKKYKYDVSFIGKVSRDKPGRYNLLKVIQTTFPNSFIPGLYGERVELNVVHETFRSSKINLNLTGISDFPVDWPLPLQHLRHGNKGRPFEVGACGGFCLSEFAPTTERIIGEVDCIAFFEGIDQCLERINYYLENESERKKKAARLKAFTEKNILSNSSANLFGNELLFLVEQNRKAKITLPLVQTNNCESIRFNLEPLSELERLKNLLRQKKILSSTYQILFLFHNNFFLALKVISNLLISILAYSYRKIR